MALIKCPDCGKDLSDKAEKCSNCGYPLAEQLRSRASDEKAKSISFGWFVFLSVVVVTIVVSLLSGGKSENSEVTISKKNNTEPTNSNRSKKWYEGGTLHSNKIRDYWAATEANRLATCADFATKTLKGKGNPTNWETKVLERAIAIKACIDEATKGLSQAQDLTVAEVAAMCTVLLGYK